MINHTLCKTIFVSAAAAGQVESVQEDSGRAVRGSTGSTYVHGADVV